MGMPESPWLPVSSFQLPAPPPSAGPAAGTLVQLPCVNEDWLALIQGALDQLRNPTAWPETLTDAALDDVLSQVDQLRDMFNVINVPCCNFELRLTDTCELQSSSDAGATWTTISGWDANFGPCVQANSIITTPPSNPGSKPMDELTCNIASYSVVNIVQVSLQKAIDNFNANQNLLQYGLDIITVIPGFTLAALFVDAVALVYGLWASISITDLESAMADPTLWSDVRCAIYTAILADGHLTQANFAAVLTNIAAISYSPSSVITSIHDYVQALGFKGLNQLQQPAGLDSTNDCTDCAGTMHYCWDQDLTISDFGFAPSFPGRSGVYVAGVGWQSELDVPAGNIRDLTIQKFIPSGFLHELCISYLSPSGIVTGGLDCLLSGVNVASHPFTHAGSGSLLSECFVCDVTCDEIVVTLRSGVGASDDTCKSVSLRGNGINPFGANNCTY